MAKDPAEIEARIVATRAELATTVDTLAQRVSPKKVAARSREATLARVQGALGVLPGGITEGSSVRWSRVAAALGAVALFGVLLVRHGKGQH